MSLYQIGHFYKIEVEKADRNFFYTAKVLAEDEHSIKIDTIREELPPILRKKDIVSANEITEEQYRKAKENAMRVQNASKTSSFS